jgi:hypothetical protein
LCGCHIARLESGKHIGHVLLLLLKSISVGALSNGVHADFSSRSFDREQAISRPIEYDGFLGGVWQIIAVSPSLRSTRHETYGTVANYEFTHDLPHD